jgi:fumarate hydratase class I
MTVISQQHFIESVADALQYISYYHPMDYIESLGRAYELEESPAAKDAIAQILTNSRMCAEGHRPICQDTGIVVAFVKVGMGVRWDTTLNLQQMVDEGVRRAYLDPDNTLRASIVADPAFTRRNTRDNTPAVVHVELVEGDSVEVTVSAKGGGSENKAKFAMLNPSDSIVDWVVKTVPTMGAGWCPPGMLGIGIGGSAEKAMVLAKESLMDPIDMTELKARGPKTPLEELRQAHRHDPQLRSHAACTFHARRKRTGAARSARPHPLAQGRLETFARGAPRRSRFFDAGTGGELEAGRTAAAERSHAHRPRRRPQAHRGPLRPR